MTTAKRRRQESGSALLIVLVMAAIIAILLYKEMPISAFEKQRQTEALLVARGGEYKHAVKLFVRKFGRFPSSIAELESTNRMRFLRRKYVDPMTGKDDWRLIHAGPGGVILDSKVASAASKSGGQATTLGTGATFAGFNNSIATADPNAQDGPANPALRQRAPAVSSSGNGAAGGAVNADFPPMPAVDGAAAPGIGNGQGLYPGAAPAASASTATNADANQNSNQTPALEEGARRFQTAASGGQMLPQQTLDAMAAMNNNPSAAAAAAGTGIGAGGAGNGAVAQQLNTQNPVQTNQSAFATTGQPGLSSTTAFPQNSTQSNAQGATTGGGIAGVASLATGKGIKTVNDQSKYSLWEFYYDLRKEQAGNAGAALQQGQTGTGQNGANQLGSGFGTSSSFGNNQSTAGQQNVTPPAATPPPPQ